MSEQDQFWECECSSCKNLWYIKHEIGLDWHIEMPVCCPFCEERFDVLTRDDE
jgi:hypothetical protein